MKKSNLNLNALKGAFDTYTKETKIQDLNKLEGIKTKRWSKYGYDRLYIKGLNNNTLGYIDLVNMVVVCTSSRVNFEICEQVLNSLQVSNNQVA